MTWRLGWQSHELAVCPWEATPLPGPQCHLESEWYGGSLWSCPGPHPGPDTPCWLWNRQRPVPLWGPCMTLGGHPGVASFLPTCLRQPQAGCLPRPSASQHPSSGPDAPIDFSREWAPLLLPWANTRSHPKPHVNPQALRPAPPRELLSEPDPIQGLGLEVLGCSVLTENCSCWCRHGPPLPPAPRPPGWGPGMGVRVRGTGL